MLKKTLKMFGIVIYSLYLCIRNQSGNRLMKSLKNPVRIDKFGTDIEIV